MRKEEIIEQNVEKSRSFKGEACLNINNKKYFIILNDLNRIFMKILIKSLAILFMAALIFSCDKDSKDPEPQVDLQVLTSTVTEISPFSAIGGGSISGSEPINDRGICWSTNESPTLDDHFVKDIDPGTGDFTGKMAVLDPDMTYFARAYATTKSGETVYGNQVQFMTEKVKARNESNSYLANRDDILVIPVSRANKSRLGEQITENDHLTAELIWMDNINVVEEVFTYGEGASGNLVVLTGDSDGNAVINVTVDDKIVWSWHIWVTEDTESIKTITLPSGSKMMDRNLGAVSTDYGEIESIGMQYQFGRKDPFPASASFGTPSDRLLYNLEEGFPEIDIQIGPKDFGFANANPLTFITSQWADWCDEDIRDWWVTEDGSKSIYDPSPEGWKVASLVDYEGLSDEHFKDDVEGGLLFIYDGQSNYFPFTGYREVEGMMDATGNYGNLWVNSAIDGDPGIGSALAPSYGIGGVQDVNGAPRGRALSIRCVKE